MTNQPKLSLRIDFPGGQRLGPGKAALLKAIAETGSINAAAALLSMSYPKALKLIEQLNQDFQQPLLQSRHGGRERGGSDLTQLGKEVLELYGRVCDDALKANQGHLAHLAKKLAERD